MEDEEKMEDKENRTIIKNVRMTQAEHDTIYHRAKKVGLDVAPYMRMKSMEE